MQADVKILGVRLQVQGVTHAMVVENSSAINTISTFGL